MLVDTRRRLTPREALAAVHGQEETDLDVLGGLDTTLDTVRDQVASELALRTLSTAETIDGARLGVLLTLGKTDDPTFLRRVARALSRQFLDTPHLFALATTGADAHLLLMGSPPASVQRALLLTMAAFSARVHASSLADDGSSFAAAVQDITPADEPVLWRALRQSLARDEHTPPPGSRGVVQRLADARRGVRRLTPREAFDAVQGVGDAAGDALGGPTFLVDIRAAPRRGGITGSLIVDRNDLEWAFDPRLAVRHLLIATSYALRPILICADGRASSLAAASLRELGLYNATDVIGGFRAWRAAGLGTWEEGGGEGVGEGEGEGEVREGEGEEAEEAEEEGEEEGEEAVGEEGERESGDGTQGEYVLL
ncbi:hypothetical protein FB451DRAFT_1035001 [Mycena latifolia]|nr:hypothetical protein FB451DRAFT_1035001 [Mycena latifolia]